MRLKVIIGSYSLKVAKVGANTTSSCIQLYGINGNDSIAASRTCFIDQGWYEADEPTTFIGHAITNRVIENSACFIGDACFMPGNAHQFKVGHWDFIDSECETCDSHSNGKA